MSEGTVSYAFEQLQPAAPPAPDAHERILAQAGAEAERIREQARREGCDEGIAEGRREGLERTATATRALALALKEIERLRENAREQLERDAVELALALAAKVVAGALQAQPERVVDVVGGALRRVADRRRTTVLVDPADLETVTQGIERLRATVGGIELCEIQADRRVGRGGAIVITAEGEIDARVDQQLERAREVVLAELQSEARER